MSPHRSLLPLATAVITLAATSPAAASFHIMQIEQLIGGYCGSPSAQAVQLRMRASNQNFISGSRLIAHDAAGQNPVILITFPSHVSNGAAGSRVLAATADFAAAGGPDPDFIFDNAIPADYLAAGKVTFESSGGIVYWSLAWGGDVFTGSNTGLITNDDDGNFSPPFAGTLPHSGNIALLFTGPAAAESTTNADDYALSPSPATFTNNDGTAAPLADCVHHHGFEPIAE